MKNLTAGLMACLYCLITPAFAQDAQDWAGRYYGASIGFVNGTSNHSWIGTPAGVDVDVSGGTIGLTYGHNYQGQNTVYGYEIDLSASDADGFLIGGITPCITSGEACSSQLDALATFRARIGVPLQNGFLPYATGGLALGKVQATADLGACGFTGDCSLSEWMFGYTFGVGIEKLFNNGWSAKAEYLYVDFGRHAMDGSASGNNVTADFSYDTFKIGVNRRF